MEDKEQFKLVAMFMGFDESEYDNSLEYYGNIEVYTKSTCHYNDMKFRTSWDWIIPVYHKIVTDMWDKGILDDDKAKTFTESFHILIMRNAPSDAFDVLYEYIKSI